MALGEREFLLVQSLQVINNVVENAKVNFLKSVENRKRTPT